MGGFQDCPFQLVGDIPARLVSQLTRGYSCAICDPTFFLMGMSDKPIIGRSVVGQAEQGCDVWKGGGIVRPRQVKGVFVRLKVEQG